MRIGTELFGSEREGKGLEAGILEGSIEIVLEAVHYKIEW